MNMPKGISREPTQKEVGGLVLVASMFAFVGFAVGMLVGVLAVGALESLCIATAAGMLCGAVGYVIECMSLGRKLKREHAEQQAQLPAEDAK